MDVQREAAWIRASADEAAEAVRRDAAREATELVAAARGVLPRSARQAAEPILQDARREADALRAAGDGAASVVRRRARKCMPDLVDHTVADALSLACGPGEGKAP